jgi:hypothetical protein
MWKGLETLENLNQGEVLIFIFLQYEAYFTYKTWGRKTNVWRVREKFVAIVSM